MISASPLNNKIKALDLTLDWDKDSTKEEEEEPILVPNGKRFVLFPIQYHSIWKIYKNSEAKFWSAEEVELADDVEHWAEMPGKTKSFICTALALVSANDCWLETSLISRLSDELQIPEARCFLGFMIMQNNIHDELFTLMFDLFTSGFSDKDAILESTKNLSGFQLKKAWVERYITDSDDHFSLRVLASAIYNFMFLSTIVDCLLHVAKRSNKNDKVFLPGLLRALSKLNRDQQEYYHFFSILLGILKNKPSQKKAELMIKEVVRIEGVLLDDLLGLSGGSVILGETCPDSTKLKQRLEFHADQCLLGMGFSACYKTKDPLPWIEILLMIEHKKDDLEHGVYVAPKAQADVKSKSQTETQVFTLSEDF